MSALPPKADITSITTVLSALRQKAPLRCSTHISAVGSKRPEDQTGFDGANW
jgi:hypothetical protein